MKTHATHVTDEQLDRYRRRVAEPSELLLVDAHIASCDRCYALVRADPNVVLPAAEPDEHPEYEEIERYVDGTATAMERELIDAHAALCQDCRMELRDLTRVRDSMNVRPMPDRAPGSLAKRPFRLWAAAAMVVVALLTAWLLFGRRPITVNDIPPQVATVATSEPPRPELPEVTLEKPVILASLVREGGVLRSGEPARTFRLEEPAGTVVLEDRPRFRWTAAPDATSYDVAVVNAERGNIAASGSTSSTGWQPPVALQRGRTYSWQVTAHVGETTVVAPGPSGAEALFHIAEREEALPENAFDRGVALARLGVLDDAERELERAAQQGEPRAAALLEQVRSWRSP